MAFARPAPPWAAETAEGFTPPFAFDSSRIVQARDTARRVNWDRAAILNRMGPAETLAGEAWNETAATALTGGREETAAALEALRRALGDEAERASAANRFILFKTYDLLAALPEYSQLGDEATNALRDEFGPIAGAVLDSTPAQDAEPTARLIDSAEKLYAALLAGRGTDAPRAMRGGENAPGFAELCRRGLPREGLPAGLRIEEALQTGLNLYTVFSAAREVFPEDCRALGPWLARFADFHGNLLAFETGRAGSVLLTPANHRRLALTLETANRLWGGARHNAALTRLYKNEPRPPEALLFGPVRFSGTEDFVAGAEAWPRAGAAFLRGASSDFRIGAAMDTGLGASFGHPAYLSLSIADRTAPPLPPAEGDWIPNTVWVNRQPHDLPESEAPLAANALIADFVPRADGTVYARATASGRFGEAAAHRGDGAAPIPVYERELYVSSPYVADLFRVLGGRAQDYIYRSRGRLLESNAADWSPYQPAAGDPDFLGTWDGLRSARMRGIHAFQMEPAEPGAPGERLWFIDPAGSEILAGSRDGETLLIVRRSFSEPTGNLFAAIHELLPASPSPGSAVYRVPLSPSPNERDFQAAAFAIEREGVHDIFLSSTNPEIEYNGVHLDEDITFQGRFAHIRVNQNQFELLRLYGGTRLRFGPHEIRLPEAAAVGVAQSADESEASMTVRFPHILPDRTALGGHLLHVVSSEPDTPFMQPFPIREARPLDVPQTFALEHPMAMTGPPGAGAAPVRTGDQALFGAVAELRHHGDNEYSVFHTVPADVWIQGPPHGNRVYMRAAYVKRMQGEIEDDRIALRIGMEESEHGEIHFRRIP